MMTDVTLKAEYGYLDISAKTQPWLDARVELNEELTERLDRWDDAPCNRHKSHLECMVTWVDMCVDRHEFDTYGEPLRDWTFSSATGIYGEGEPVMVNTYNHESILDEVLQFLYLETLEHGELVILQRHRGGDVRGNYARPEVFNVVGDELCMFDDTRAYFGCEVCDERWSADDGYTIYSDRSGRETLNDLELREVTDRCASALKQSRFTPNTDGLLLHKDDGTVLCPACYGPILARA